MDLVARRQVHDRAGTPIAAATCSASVLSGHGSSAPMLNTSFHAPRLFNRRRHHRRHVVDVAERARLRAVAEDRHRLALQDLIHEDADDVAVAVADVLPLAVDVVRPEDDVVEPEHRAAGGELLLDGVLGDAVRVFRARACVSSVIGTIGLRPYTAIEEVNTKPLTPVFTEALIRLTLPITLFV